MALNNKWKKLPPLYIDQPIDGGSVSFAGNNANNILKYQFPPAFSYMWGYDHTKPSYTWDATKLIEKKMLLFLGTLNRPSTYNQLYILMDYDLSITGNNAYCSFNVLANNTYPYIFR
jgi:hypothetical protein